MDRQERINEKQLAVAQCVETALRAQADESNATHIDLLGALDIVAHLIRTEMQMALAAQQSQRPRIVAPTPGQARRFGKNNGELHLSD